MSLSEVFDHGVPIPWANLRNNNLNLDGTFSTGGKLSVLYTHNVTFSNTAQNIYLTIPIINNSVFEINIIAIAYTTIGFLGAGCYSKFNEVLSFVGGSLLFSNTIENTTTPFGYSGAMPIGALITTTPISIECKVENTNPGNTTQWIILTNVISNVIQ